jgi:hypothetical protein
VIFFWPIESVTRSISSSWSLQPLQNLSMIHWKLQGITKTWKMSSFHWFLWFTVIFSTSKFHIHTSIHEGKSRFMRLRKSS